MIHLPTVSFQDGRKTTQRTRPSRPPQFPFRLPSAHTNVERATFRLAVANGAPPLPESERARRRHALIVFRRFTASPHPFRVGSPSGFWSGQQLLGVLVGLAGGVERV